MNERLGRTLFFIAIALVAALTLYETFEPPHLGRNAFAWSYAAGVPGHVRVTAVQPGSVAAHDLRAGDDLTLADMSFPSVAHFYVPAAGMPFTYLRTRDGRTTAVTVVAPPARARITVIFLAYSLLRLLMLAMAAFIILRAFANEAARLVALAFIAFTFMFEPLAALGSAPGWLICADVYLRQPAILIGAAALVRFMTLFPTPATHSGTRFIRTLTPWITVAFVLNAWRLGTLALQLRQWTQLESQWIVVPYAYYVIAITYAFLAAERRATNADRQRLRWVAASIVVGSLGYLTFFAFYTFDIITQWAGYLPLSAAALPVGLTYAILRHRVVDLGFVLNRALVFTVVSAIVVACFACVEWLLAHTLVTVGHITSSSVELAVALGLGFSLRALHRRAERIIDDLFYRKRRNAAAAIREFAAALPFVPSAAGVVSQTVQAVERYAGSDGVSMYVRHDAHYRELTAGDEQAPTLALNDIAVVRMRSSHAMVYLEDCLTHVKGAIAFPMFVRGELAGVLSCGSKRAGGIYTPDELDEIARLAVAAALALDALSVHALATEVDRLLGSGASGLEALRDARAALAGPA